MSQIKVGDIVQRTRNSLPNMVVGSVYEVSEVSNLSGTISLGFKELNGFFLSKYFTVIKPAEPSKKDKQSTEWSFCVHTQEEIRFTEMYKELSTSNPVALIKDETGLCIALIHDSLKVKAKALYLSSPPVVLEEKDFSKVVQWAKEVKASPWKLPKRKITVSLPRI